MPTILHIESSTLTCSVAISNNGKTIALRESHDLSYAHSEKLVIYINEALKEANLKPTDLHAVCVAKGPGSYTGLRIGVSAAKGMCYVLEIPLLSVGSLRSMANWAMQNHKLELTNTELLCPMIDARRMEVYTALFSTSLKEEKPVSADIIDEQSFASELEKGKVVFFGDGAAKCQEVIQHPNAVFLENFKPSARGMISIAEQKLAQNELEDVAYFEPYYLKDFVAGKPKKMF
ncbi:MAG: tRNA (adenosine(37)-N6)-threonylcarbamoyltransferase complex dimerization subunit type 1 TsaB [Flavobacteriales bacterium]|nr:tRNA (adenosine(37)-N6)-threonylcarbamoyltransferase complex dimerization subunit type 1 TsaB [Flavobacteriales bacterium]